MEIKNKFTPDPKIKLMDQVRQVLRYHHYSMSTEKTYCDWISRYIKFHQCKRHPSEMGKREIEDFLSHLAVDLKVSASTQGIDSGIDRGRIKLTNLIIKKQIIILLCKFLSPYYSLYNSCYRLIQSSGKGG